MGASTGSFDREEWPGYLENAARAVHLPDLVVLNGEAPPQAVLDTAVRNLCGDAQENGRELLQEILAAEHFPTSAGCA
jgi:hypothetical protein